LLTKMSTLVKSLKLVSKQARRSYLRLSRFQQLCRLGKRNILTSIHQNHYNHFNNYNKFNKLNIVKNVNNNNLLQSCNISPSLIYFNQRYITTRGTKQQSLFQISVRGMPGGGGVAVGGGGGGGGAQDPNKGGPNKDQGKGQPGGKGKKDDKNKKGGAGGAGDNSDDDMPAFNPEFKRQNGVDPKDKK